MSLVNFLALLHTCFWRRSFNRFRFALFPSVTLLQIPTSISAFSPFSLSLSSRLSPPVGRSTHSHHDGVIRRFQIRHSLFDFPPNFSPLLSYSTISELFSRFLWIALTVFIPGYNDPDRVFFSHVWQTLAVPLSPELCVTLTKCVNLCSSSLAQSVYC